MTENFEIGKGVRQGCILSPILFNAYGEFIMRTANLDQMEEGISIGGQRINNLRYADDTTLMSSTIAGLENMLKAVKHASEQCGLHLNVAKTKTLTTDNQNTHITIDGVEVESVDEMVFLGSVITKDNKSDT